MLFTKKTYHSLGEKKHFFTLIIVVLVFGGAFLGIRTSKVELEGDNLKISGMYGVNVNMSEVVEASLKDDLPENIKKNNGIDFFNIKYIGEFSSDNLGKINMYVYSDKGPYLYITLNSGEYNHIIVAYKDKKQTEALYRNIINKKNKK